MKIYTDKETAHIVRDGEVSEWPYTKALKLSQRYNSLLHPYDYHVLTWKSCEEYIARLLPLIPLNIKRVTCPPGRGGLVPAAILAYKLNIPYIPWELTANLSDVVCIDDIIDTGTTFKKCMDSRPQMDFVAMTSRWTSFGLPVGRILYTPHYIIFPWDPTPEL